MQNTFENQWPKIYPKDKKNGGWLMRNTDPEEVTLAPALHLACLSEAGVLSHH